MTKVAEKEIVKIVQKTVLESLRNVFNDSDYGLEFTDSIKRRLSKISRSQKSFISLADARKKYA